MIPNPWLRRFVSVLALVVVFVSAARLWQDAWAFAALVSWYLAILAWLRGRKGLLRFRKREVQFLLGRLETALVKEKECKEALTLKTVAATIVGEFEQLLEAVKRDRDAIKKELLENLEDCLRDQKKQKEGG